MWVHGSQQFVTLARKNLKTGMIYFKSKRANPRRFFDSDVNPYMPPHIINTQKAWDELVNEQL